VLDDNGNFHAQDVGKLIGKAVMCDIKAEVQRWGEGENRKSKVVVNAEITAKLGPRDVPYFESDLKGLLTDDLFGFVLFNGENDEHTLKTLNSGLVNTMKLSPEFEGSKLKGQLEALGKLGGNGGNSSSQAPQSGVNSSQGQSPSQSETPAQKVHEGVKQVPTYNEPPMDFDDD
jgi:hypothetical protein